MNKFIGQGRLGRDPELKDIGSTSVCNFSIAIDRRFKNKQGERDTDWFNCSAFGKTAEFISQWFGKGSQIIVVGEMQNREYVNKDGMTVRVTELKVDEAYFSGPKQQKNDFLDGKTESISGPADLPFDI